MIAPLAKFMDWQAVQALTAYFRHQGGNERLDEALAFLKGSDFIPDESQAARIEFNGATSFQFPSPRPSIFAENNVAYGRLYPCAGDWRKCPAIILLHGGGAFPDYRFLFPRIARRCNQSGLNAATLLAPQPCSSNQPVRARISAIACAAASDQLK